MQIYENLSLEDFENEIWKNVEEFPDYQVSNLGRVKSFKRYRKGKILKQHKNSAGYFQVILWKNGEKKHKQIHRLVFETHNNYKLKSDEDVHHLDFINILPGISKENNNLDNLMMISDYEHNSLHHIGKHHSEETRKKMSEKTKGEKHPNHKLTEEQVVQIKLLLKEGILTQQEIADMFGVSQLTISNIKTGKRWSYI